MVSIANSSIFRIYTEILVFLSFYVAYIHLVMYKYKHFSITRKMFGLLTYKGGLNKMLSSTPYQIPNKRYKMPIKYGEMEAYLTRRETIIVALLIRGMRAKQIAWELNSSLHTVNTHLSNIKGKLHCDNIFQLGLILGDYKSQITSITFCSE